MALDFHILVQFEGEIFVTNFQGVPGASRQAEFYDVVMSMTQQGNEFLREFTDLMEKEGQPPEQIEALASQWGVLDDEAKAWLEARHFPERFEESFERIRFEQDLVEWQTWVMQRNRGAIGDVLDLGKLLPPITGEAMTWFLTAGEDELRSALEIYRERCWEIRQKQAEIELDPKAYPDGQWSGDQVRNHLQMEGDFVRLAAYIWVIRRRLGEL